MSRELKKWTRPTERIDRPQEKLNMRFIPDFTKETMVPEKTSMPIFILFDTKTGYLYGHLFATGPEDPFLHEVVEWWGTHCSTSPIGVDYPGLTQAGLTHNTLSSN